MVKVNLKKEKSFEPVLIEPDTYDAAITNISDIFRSQGFNGSETEKLIISFILDYRDGNKIQLPLFVSAVVSQGNGDYSNSKLYDILEQAQQIELFEQFNEELNKIINNQEKNNSFVLYLKKNFLNKRCKILVKTIQSKNGDDYSVVDKVIKFYS
jgi:hypothetical protein